MFDALKHFVKKGGIRRGGSFHYSREIEFWNEQE
jgi:hypothetical protein